MLSSIKDTLYNVTAIGKKAFKGCSFLKSVSIGKNIEVIGESAFHSCKKLKKISIPGKVRRIGKAAFRKCVSLKNIVIKTKRLSASNIGANAFSGTSKKVKVVVPKSKKSKYTKILLKRGLVRSAIITA